MATIILHRCDICNKEQKTNGFSPNDWFEFDYCYSDVINSKNVKNIEYLTCSFKCYIIMIDRLLSVTENHCNVTIAGMSKQFARKILRGVDCDYLMSKTVVQPNYDFLPISSIIIEKPNIENIILDKNIAVRNSDIKAPYGYSKDELDILSLKEKFSHVYRKYISAFGSDYRPKSAIYSKWYALKQSNFSSNVEPIWEFQDTKTAVKMS